MARRPLGTEIVTLENLSDKLAPWSAADESQLHAVVDMGSNGIRFSITSLAPPKTRLLVPVFSTRAPISLFDALLDTPEGLVFPQSTITQVCEAMAEFHHLAIVHGVPSSNFLVLATEAMRRASNAAQMLEAIGAATEGVRVNILSPPVETLFGAVMGCRSRLSNVDGGAIFLDLGGGSVQMTWVDTSEYDYETRAPRSGISMPFGAAKLSKVLQGPVDSRGSQIENLKTSMQAAFLELCNSFPILNSLQEAYRRGNDAKVDVYMCGGGFRGYGSMLMHADNQDSPYPFPSVDTYSIDGALFKQTSKMRLLNDTHEGAVHGMSSRRRQQFPAIVMVVDAFISTVPNIGRVTFCGGSNRDGVLMMKLPRVVRESNPLHVLSGISAERRPTYDAMSGLLSQALPRDASLSAVPTIFSLGLVELYLEEIWSRHGHESDTNSSHALHNALNRDSGTPGLSHLARAVLGLTTYARWNGDLTPIDAQIQAGLRKILDSWHRDATFWTLYIGAVSSLLFRLFPIPSVDIRDCESIIRLESRITSREAKRDMINLTVNISPSFAQRFDLMKSLERINKTGKPRGHKSSFKVHAHINIIAS